MDSLTFADCGPDGNITYGQTVTYDNNTYAETYLTPTVLGTTWYWTQAITPAILGTVFIVVNDHNQTKTVTSTDRAAVANNTQYMVNGTLSLLTRTDVDERGTVTVQLPSAGRWSAIVVAYPTPYATAVEPIAWPGIFPRVSDGITCCHHSVTTSAVPQNHYPFPSLTGSTNSRDPRGWLYAMTESRPDVYRGSQNVSSFLAPATIASFRQHCPHQRCGSESSALGAFAVNTAGALLETTTVSVTGTFSTSASPSVTAKPSREDKTTSSEKGSTARAPVPSNPSAPNPVSSPKSSPTESPVPPSRTTELGVSPASRTAADNAEISIGQVQGVTSAADSDTLTASKEGATGVQAATELLMIDSNLNVIHSTTATTQAAAEAQKTSPASVQITSAENIGVVIGSFLKSIVTDTEAEIQTSADSRSSPVAVGSTNLALQGTEIVTIVSGVSTNIAAVLLGSQTIALGASGSVGSVAVAVITTAGKTAVVVGGSSTHVLPQASSTPQERIPPPIIVGSSTISADSNSEYVVGGQTLAPGSSITIGSTPIALQTGGLQDNVLVVGSSSSILQQLTTAPLPIVIGSSTITANAISQYIVAGQTLQPGSTITIGNTPIALNTDGSEGNVLVVGISSSILEQVPELTGKAPPIVLKGSSITANSDSKYVVAGQTFQLGSSITIGSGASTLVIALQTQGSDTILVVGSSTSTLQQEIPTAVLPENSARITPIASSKYVIGSQTLVPGAPAITVSGTKYSLAPDGERIVAGSSTKVMTSADDLGGYIWSALGGTSVESSSTNSREAGTTTNLHSASVSGPLSESGTSQKASPTKTEQSGASRRVRPVCLLISLAVVFWVCC